MKNVTFWKAITAALFLPLLWTAPAAAQTAIRVDVPFAFTAGKQALPPGGYVVRVDREHMISYLTQTDGPVISMVRLVPGGPERSRDSAVKGMLRFEKRAGRYALAGIWSPGATEGNAVAGSRQPKEYARSANTAEVLALQ